MKSIFFDSQKSFDEFGKPLYDRPIKAENYRKMNASVFGNGVYITPQTECKVIATANDNTVKVQAGRMWINGAFGWVENDGQEVVFEPADKNLSRYIAIVVRLDDSLENRDIELGYIMGVPNANPIKPQPIRNSTRYDLVLAYILQSPNTTIITDSNIQDTRADSDLCGYVKGVVEEIDTTSIFNQFTTAFEELFADSEADYSQWSNEQRNQFDIWFEQIKGQLSTDAAGNLQRQIGALQNLTTTNKNDLVSAINEVKDNAYPMVETKEELQSLTESGYVTDALIVKDIDSSLGKIVENYGSSTYNTLEKMIGKWIDLGMLVTLSGDPDPTTWVGIKNAINQNVHNQILNVGDEVTSSIGEVFVVLHIDYKIATYGRNVLFGRKNCLPDTRQMNSTATNVGGFNASALCDYLNNEYYESLPADMKPFISTFTYQGGVGNGVDAVQNETHKIWLPLEYNISGEIDNSSPTELSLGNAQQFTYFKTMTNRVKTLGDAGEAYYWWVASPSQAYADKFCNVDISGVITINNAHITIGVLPCFAILAD